MRILVSSFEPFGKHAVNASSEVARVISASGVAGAEIVTVELPVVRYVAAERLVETLERVRPDALVMLGIADKRAEITPERVAINVDDYRIPDNAGNQPVDEAIVEGGPAAYLATLPLKPIVAALEAAEIPVSLSNTAGTYICNHVTYAVLRHIERTGAATRAGFLHIPQMREAAEPDAPSLPLETLVRGVRVALEAVSDTYR